jgi:predicted PurR-regulated permease PerM
MNTDDDRRLSFTLRVFIGLASVGLALFFLRESADLFNSLLLAWVIVIAASPLLRWLQRKGIRNWLVFLITLFVILAVFGGVVLLLVFGVAQLVEAIPTYMVQLEATKEALQQFLQSLSIDHVDVSTALNLFDPGSLVDALVEFLVGLAAGLSDIILVLLIVIFLLVEAFRIPAKVTSEIELGNAYVKRLSEFTVDIRQYIVITTTIGLVTGTLDTILFLIVGVDFALLWGVLAFLLSYIPSIGFWLAAIPPAILALLEFGPSTGLVTFLGIVLINGFAENVVKPKFMGEGLDLSPFVVVFSVIFWTAILGPLGAILSIPMTLVIKELILDADDKNRWLARMMGAGRRRRGSGTPEAGSQATGTAPDVA